MLDPDTIDRRDAVHIERARPGGRDPVHAGGSRPTSSPAPIALTYVLPIRCGPDDGFAELAAYLLRIRDVVDQLIVVDGSQPAARAAHAALLPGVEVIPPELVTPMGKVGGVVTGLRHARN